MALYAISDLHLSTFTDKPMDIFEGWQDYIPRILSNWDTAVKDDDIIVIPGDLSWAINFDEAESDFRFLDDLKGKKILLKGNHDLWYSTATKTANWLKEKGFSSISMLNNNSYSYGDYAIAGTRGWILDRDSEDDMKVYNREIHRLEASLDDAISRNPKEIIVFLHYPPVYSNYEHSKIVEILIEYGIKRCYYGHVHGSSIPYAINGVKYGIEFKLISADYLQFRPLLVVK